MVYRKSFPVAGATIRCEELPLRSEQDRREDCRQLSVSIKPEDLPADFDEFWSLTLQLWVNSFCVPQSWIVSLSAESASSQISVKMGDYGFPEINCEVLEVDIHPSHALFKERNLALSKGYTYRVFFKAGDLHVYVNKEVLQLDSPYFRQLLFQIQNAESLVLEDVTRKEFLEYVYSIHPPTLKLTTARIHRIILLAKTFGNLTLLAACQEFLRNLDPEKASDKAQMLVWSDAACLPQLFGKTIDEIDFRAFQSFNLEVVLQFEEENRRRLLERLFGFLGKKQVVPPIEFKSTLQKRHRFLVNRKSAEKKGFDCILAFDAQKDAKVYVKASRLALQSTFFKKLLFNQSGELLQQKLKLKDVSQEEFLEYLRNVYAPNTPLSLNRVGLLLRLANRFQNLVLQKQCEDFLCDATPATIEEKLVVLELADSYAISDLFSEALLKFKGSDLNALDVERTLKLRSDNLKAVMERVLEEADLRYRKLEIFKVYLLALFLFGVFASLICLQPSSKE